MRKTFILLLIVLAGVASVICLLLYNERRTALEFGELFTHQKNAKIAEMKFVGQGRSVRLSDSKTLAIIEDALKKPSTGPMQLGLSYEATIILASRRAVKLCVYVHEDKNGITVVNPFKAHAGDPETTLVRFSRPVDPRLQALMNSLVP